jgi:hypothetical protein
VYYWPNLSAYCSLRETQDKLTESNRKIDLNKPLDLIKEARIEAPDSAI